VPRGFDPAARTFLYQVNPRFAETRPSRTVWREPFRLTIDVNVRMHVDADLQVLRRAIEPVRVNGAWERRSVDSIAAIYLRETSSVHRFLVLEADSLLLRPEQVRALREYDLAFSDSVRRIYRSLAEQLARNAESKVALEYVAAAQRAYWDIFWQQLQPAAAVLDSWQVQRMPILGDALALPVARRGNTEYSFEASVPLVHSVAQPRKN
jgi:hypothetical protein